MTGLFDIVQTLICSVESDEKIHYISEYEANEEELVCFARTLNTKGND